MNKSKISLASLTNSQELSALCRLFNDVEHNFFEQVQDNSELQNYTPETQSNAA